MTVFDIAALELGERLGKGGQGTVRAVLNQRINGKWPVVYKEYLPAVLPSVRIDVLEQMVKLVPALPFEDGEWLAAETAWPAALVTSGGATIGFLMRAVPEEFQFAFRSLGASAPARRLANVEFLLNDDAYVAGIGLRVSERDRLHLLVALARTLDRLHRLEIAVGDLSPKNLLFATEPKPKCFVIDCDATRLRGAGVMDQVETPGWQVPQGEPKATRASDAYKFGLLAIRLFARDQVSTDPAALGAVSPALGALARDSLSPGVDRRPPPGGWIDELMSAAINASTRHAAAAGPSRPAAAMAGAAAQPTGAGFTFGPPPPGQMTPAMQGAAGARRSPLRAFVTTVVALLLAGGIGTAIYSASHASAAGNNSTYGSDNNRSTSGYGQSVPSDTPSDSPSPSPSPVTTQVGQVQIAADIAQDPRAAQVATMFDAYFGGIDTKNYSQALAQFDPNGVINPGDPAQVQQFEQADSTSNDTQVQLLGIQPGDQSSAVTSADITFRSTQAAGMGPSDDPNETCTDWRITYALTQSSSGGYLINNTPSATHQVC